MDQYFEALEKSKNSIALNIVEQMGFDETADVLEKGRAAQMGEMRIWSGVKYQKTPQGWVPVKGEQKSEKKEPEAEKKDEKPVEKKEGVGKKSKPSNEIEESLLENGYTKKGKSFVKEINGYIQEWKPMEISDLDSLGKLNKTELKTFSELFSQKKPVYLNSIKDDEGDTLTSYAVADIKSNKGKIVSLEYEKSHHNFSELNEKYVQDKEKDNEETFQLFKNSLIRRYTNSGKIDILKKNVETLQKILDAKKWSKKDIGKNITKILREMINDLGGQMELFPDSTSQIWKLSEDNKPYKDTGYKYNWLFDNWQRQNDWTKYKIISDFIIMSKLNPEEIKVDSKESK